MPDSAAKLDLMYSSAWPFSAFFLHRQCNTLMSQFTRIIRDHRLLRPWLSQVGFMVEASCQLFMSTGPQKLLCWVCKKKKTNPPKTHNQKTQTTQNNKQDWAVLDQVWSPDYSPSRKLLVNFSPWLLTTTAHSQCLI